MKLIFIAPGALEIPVSTYGGIERVIWNLANGFLDRNYEVKILAPKNKGYTDEKNIIIDPNIYVKYRNFDIRDDLSYHSKKYLNGVFNFLDNDLDKGDVVFLNHSEQTGIRNYLEEKKIKFFEIGHYRNFSGNTNIIFPSKALSKLFFYKSGYVIPHPIDFKEFYISEDKPIISDDYLLSVGRICKNKRTMNALKIANKLGMTCVVAGPIQDKKYADSFLDDCIYMGDCSSRELRNLYSNAKVTACLTTMSPLEAFGLFQVEAQACGSKVISSKTGGLNDTFFDNCCVEYSSYKGIDNVCKKFISLVKSKKMLSKNKISEQAKENFSIEAVVDLYIKKLKL